MVASAHNTRPMANTRRFILSLLPCITNGDSYNMCCDVVFDVQVRPIIAPFGLFEQLLLARKTFRLREGKRGGGGVPGPPGVRPPEYWGKPPGGGREPRPYDCTLNLNTYFVPDSV